MKRISMGLREHRLFCLGFPLLLVVMTWPTFIYVFDRAVFWLPSTNPDVWMKFWDAWYLQFIAADAGNFLITDKLFYPSGLSLVYHNFSLPHMLLFSALQHFMPASNAFNLCFLVIVGINGVAVYVYLTYLCDERWLGMFGALVFALSPFVLSQPHHPDVILIAAVPMSLYYLDRGIFERRWTFIALSGLFIASTLFTGMYIFVCLLITAGLYALGYIRRFRSSPAFWLRLLFLALVVGSVSLLRVYPLIENSASFADALDKTGGVERNQDLLASFVNRAHPLSAAALQDENRDRRPNLNDASYLGYLPLLLIAAGLIRGSDRRKLAPWLLLLLFFFVLRLGSILEVDGRRFEQILLPKHFLDEMLPFLFQPFWDTSLFQIGAALPVTVLVCYGLLTLQKQLPLKYRIALMAVALLFTAFEYYQVLSPLTVPGDAHQFLAWLHTEDDQDQIRLIHLPMGRHESKRYGYFQSLSGYPHLEGLASRTPPSAYAYIDGNLILKTWRRARSIHCLPASRNTYLAALDKVGADGLTHIVLHLGWQRSRELAPSFAGLQPAYEDRYTRIYRLRQLAETCDNESIALPETFAHLRQLALSPSLIADDGMSIVSFHPAEGMDGETLRYLSSLFLYWKSFEHVSLLDGRRRVQRFNADDRDAPAMPAGNQVIVLSYDPRRDDAEGLDSLREDFAAGYRVCGRFVEAADAIAEYYAPVAFPCALVAAADKFEVAYDSQLRLTNLLYEVDGSSLSLFAWWTEKPDAPQAISLQIFDAEEGKVAGQDFTVGVDPLARYQVDLSSLEAGDYSLKMIVYNYETRASAAGTVISDGTRFERELEIGPITVG